MSMDSYSFSYIFIFLFGLATGSFLNCLICRLEVSQSPFLGRSRCPKCEHRLVLRDLIPVLSFILLKGKCRYCSKKISWQYPLVEISTALIFLSIFNSQFSISNEFLIFNFLNLIYYWLISSFLIAIFVYDLKHYIIPDQIVYPAIGSVLLYRLFGILNFDHWDLFGNWKLEIGNWQPLLNPFLSAFFAASFFLLIILVSGGRWMGLGDVKLAFLMGLFLAFPDILVALFFAFLIGAIMGVGLIVFKKKTLKSEIPFGPFLVVGTFIALFFGEKIIEWYLGFPNNLFF